jgi:DNA repair photolyase
MIPPIIHEIQARSALNEVRGMAFRWSLNPYKGCAHACSYCYARAYHAFLDLPLSTFESRLFAKINLHSILRSELRRTGWQHEHIAIGTATDPYQPIEGQYRITRRCLEEMAEVANPGSVTTKGTLVTRDLDLLAELARITEFGVNVSLISLDRDLVRKLEPGTPSPSSRLKTIETLAAAGVPVSLFLSPIIPGITDDARRMRELVEAAAAHGAKDAWGSALRLGPGVKEHFLETVAEEFASLAPAYRRWYASSVYLPTGYQLSLAGQLDNVRREAGLPAPEPAPTPALRTLPARRQLALPI